MLTTWARWHTQLDQANIRPTAADQEFHVSMALRWHQMPAADPPSLQISSQLKENPKKKPACLVISVPRARAGSGSAVEVGR